MDPNLLSILNEWREEKCKSMHAALVEEFDSATSYEAVDAWIESAEPEYVLSNGRAIAI